VKNTYFILLVAILFISCQKNKEEVDKKLIDAGVLYGQRELEDSLKIYKHILTLDSKSEIALVMAGKIEFYSRRFEDSLSYFQRALSIDKDNLYYQYWYARACSMVQGKEKESLDFIVKVLNQSVSEIELLQTQAVIYEKTGNIKEALNTYSKIIENEPKIALAHLRLGSMYHKAGLKDMEKKSFNRALVLSERNQPLSIIIQKELKALE
jgi:tetratricopeptide (TPR) repeat protein